MRKIIRTSTVPISLNVLLKGQLKFLSNYFTIIGVSSKGKEMTEVEQREGIRTVVVNMERGISPLRDMISLIKLLICFACEKPDIVHSITPKAGLLTMLAGKLTGIPIRMHTFTGLIFPSRTGVTQKLLLKMDQLLCWAATNIYPEGEGVKNDLITYRITKKPLRILANGNVNGIDLSFFSKQNLSEDALQNLRKKINIKKTDFVFIFVGRLSRDKGINELVSAFKMITLSQSKTQNSKLLLVGPLESKLNPLMPETLLEIEENPDIISVGFQNDVRPYFAISDALAFPSFREGFPNVVMQAGAMELPSIVTNINGCNEIILEGKNGLIVPAKNTEALHNAMCRLIKDPVLYDKLKKNARRLIVERYDQQLVWQEVLNEYHTLLKGIALR